MMTVVVVVIADNGSVGISCDDYGYIGDNSW